MTNHALMRKQIEILLLFGLGISLAACYPSIGPEIETSINPTRTFTSTPIPLPTPSPTPTPSPVPTLTSTPTPDLSPTPTTVTDDTAQIPILPEAILDESFSQLLGKGSISYQAPVSLEAVQDFYEETLTAQGWEWVYTDIGESLVMADLTPVLAQEFKRGDHRLAIVAIDDFSLFTPEDRPNVLIMSAQDTSSGEIMFFFSSLMVDMTPPVGPEQEVIDLTRRQFTSELVQFEHPVSWFPTRWQMVTFPTDIGENKVNILEKRCTNDDEVCFVNFMLFNGATQYQAPISIRVRSVDDDVTLEDFDVRRWAELANTAENPLATPENIEWPEDLTDASSLEAIETKLITLQDNTPALQRFYRWHQVKLSTPLVSSYILFKHNDTIIEFHTDFTEEEWGLLSTSVQETIFSIRTAP
jgi:hypothetical protein